jgi:hypothetical protein
MNRRLFLVATLILLAATPIIAQQPNASQRSYQQARRVLDDAIEAHGGVEALRAIKDFTLKEKGKLHARFQSPGAEPPFAVGTSEETLIVDTERGLVFDDLKTANAGFNNWTRTVVKGTEGQTEQLPRTDSPAPAIRIARGIGSRGNSSMVRRRRNRRQTAKSNQRYPSGQSTVVTLFRCADEFVNQVRLSLCRSDNRRL